MNTPEAVAARFRDRYPWIQQWAATGGIVGYPKIVNGWGTWA